MWSAGLAWCDAERMLLPKRLVYLTLLATGCWLVLVAATQGGWGHLGVAVAVAAVAEAVFAVWAFARPGALGFGDVRLVGLVGLGVGWVAPILVPVAVTTAVIAAGIFGLVGVAAGRLLWASRLPLGTFLAASGVATVIVMPK